MGVLVVAVVDGVLGVAVVVFFSIDDERNQEPSTTASSFQNDQEIGNRCCKQLCSVC